MMIRVRRSLCLAAVAALPFTVGAGVAGASGVSADRFRADTNTNLTDGDHFLVDLRVASIDDDGDATGIRSRTTSSDIRDIQDVRTDNRIVSNDEGHDATSTRAILGVDDLRSLDNVDSDVNVVNIDQSRDTDQSEGMGTGHVVGQRNGRSDEQQYGEDAEFVFGP